MKNYLMNVAVSLGRLLATDQKLTDISTEVNNILKIWVGPLLIAIGGVGAVYMIVMGIQYAKSESDGKRAEIKSRLVNCIIGVISILVLGSLCIGIDWAGVVQIFGYAAE